MSGGGAALDLTFFSVRTHAWEKEQEVFISLRRSTLSSQRENACFVGNAQLPPFSAPKAQSPQGDNTQRPFEIVLSKSDAWSTKSTGFVSNTPLQSLRQKVCPKPQLQRSFKLETPGAESWDSLHIGAWISLTPPPPNNAIP